MTEQRSVDSKILSLDELVERRRVLREQGHTVVHCHGCFDIVHPGHIRYLRFARSLGDVLVVSITGDAAMNKGIGRPLVGERLRAENLAALEFVDYVTIDPNAWAGPLLERLRPDIYVKGKEYETNADPRFLRERQLVESYGGRVVFSSGDVVFSSTEIIARMGERFELEAQRVAAYCRRHALHLDGVEARLASLHGLHVVVVGDALVDRYVHCEALRFASESPIPTVTPVHEDRFAGGGALVALQLAALGAEVTLLTAADPGADFERFRSLLDQGGVRVELIEAPRRPVYEKVRFLVEGTKLFKVDHGRPTPLPTPEAQAFARRLVDLARQASGVIATDFGYGLFGSAVLAALDELTASGTALACDVSGSPRASILRFPRPLLATPNEAEMRAALGDDEAGLSNLAVRWFEQTGGKGLLLTLGSRGVVTFAPPLPGTRRALADFLPALSSHAIDPVGAGDVLLALAAGAQFAGASLGEAAYLGSCVAALHVNRLGNGPVHPGELLHLVRRRPEWAL